MPIGDRVGAKVLSKKTDTGLLKINPTLFFLSHSERGSQIRRGQRYGSERQKKCYWVAHVTEEGKESRKYLTREDKGKVSCVELLKSGMKGVWGYCVEGDRVLCNRVA